MKQVGAWLRLTPRTRRAAMALDEIDALRGAAVVMMIIYHFMYDLHFFGYSRQVFDAPFWTYFQHATASLFIVVAGVSAALAAQSPRLAPRPFLARWRVFALRGGIILGWGLVLTLITRLALGPQAYIRFGILHLIGLSIAVSYPFLTRPWLALALGLPLYLVGSWLDGLTFAGPVTRLAWLGFKGAAYAPVDHFPLIRWFGLFLIGICVGRQSYARREGTALGPRLQRFGPLKALRFLGQRSLPIYLLHQPVLFLLFGLASWARP